jgi:hypothetical protein
LAWLHCIPNEKKESRYDQFNRDKSRWVNLPEVEYGHYLLEFITALGFASSDGSPITFQEIEAYKRLMGISLTAWEAETIRVLSREYTSQLSDRDANAPPPYDIKPLTREEVGSKVKDAFKSLRR